ncbi:hypothetical protein L9F63_013833 [Diploptera punctata]|uniref:Carboxylesterase type B domain-containing protein n=1 Tax=Diploptera punctata TaxID=6984 RepID=A0AAD8AAT5_DIPPU|nr:hypothetical protein L9F63_013833 [Diploptera punctata]
MRGTTMTSRSGRTFHAFLGIPYAQPPVGDLRFKAPEPPGMWPGVLNATADGPMCMQKNYMDANPQVQGQEDCLYLNVYTHDVMMVYIHGGGFFSGTGASYFWVLSTSWTRYCTGHIQLQTRSVGISEY